LGFSGEIFSLGNRLTTKRFTGKSSFELVYRITTLFPNLLAMPIAKLIQDVEEEPNPPTRRIKQLVELNESIE